MRNESTTEQHQYIRLQLDEDQLTFIFTTGGVPTQSIHGSVSGTRHALEQRHLTCARVEEAINEVEDLLMPMLRALPACTELKVSGPELETVFEILSTDKDAVIALASVETLFNEFSSHAGGSPIAWHHSASPAHVALGLIVLREVMHHGGFTTVSLAVGKEDQT